MAVPPAATSLLPSADEPTCQKSSGRLALIHDAPESLEVQTKPGKSSPSPLGVPWNNNNAEHAIKPFAKYRTLVNGRITKTGLEDYLVLLSVQQTCEYKGVSFLQFLRSEKRDVDEFCETV